MLPMRILAVRIPSNRVIITWIFWTTLFSSTFLGYIFKKQINPDYLDCWSYTINHIPPFIFKDTRVIINPYTLDRDPCINLKHHQPTKNYQFCFTFILLWLIYPVILVSNHDHLNPGDFFFFSIFQLIKWILRKLLPKWPVGFRLTRRISWSMRMKLRVGSSFPVLIMRYRRSKCLVRNPLHTSGYVNMLIKASMSMRENINNCVIRIGI